MRLFTLVDVFGGWREAQRLHFDDDGIYDRLFQQSTAARGGS